MLILKWLVSSENIKAMYFLPFLGPMFLASIIPPLLRDSNRESRKAIIGSYTRSIPGPMNLPLTKSIIMSGFPPPFLGLLLRPSNKVNSVVELLI